MNEREDINQIIEEFAPKIAERFNEIAKDAKTEEDVRHNCNKLIEAFIERAGLKINGKHEFELLGGRIDSKYGGVIIEYKKPHGFFKITENLDDTGTKAVINQIKGRFDDFSSDPNLTVKRIFGVGLDGDTIVFVSKIGNEWQISANPVTAFTIEKLLRALISVGAKGKNYTSENLNDDFGAKSKIAIDAVKNFYNAIVNSENPKTEVFFKEWKIHFGEVCGYDIEGRSTKLDELKEMYELPNAKPAELLFSIHTYFSVFIKFLAADITSFINPMGTSIIRKIIEASSNEIIFEECSKIEDGGLWKDRGIKNYLEGNLFSWYIESWDENIAKSIHDMGVKFDKYDSDTLSAEPEESRDLLKKLYHALFPRKVRHDLGEYYTPDWLAEYVLEELDYDGNPNIRILDPACGSGTFLIMIINRIQKWFNQNRFSCGFDKTELLKLITKNVIGFDLNPLAVMASRTNYLIACKNLLRGVGSLEIPVYLCDSILTPSEYGGLFENTRELRISALENPIQIPIEVTKSSELLGRYTSEIEECIKNDCTEEEFLKRLVIIGIEIKNEREHFNLYKNLYSLKAQKKNGIWARIIKNAFAPLFIEKVDFIAGNPPWVNWENLPEEYRNHTKELWENYGLFSLSGHAARLGGGKKDLSMIFTYSCVDNYLKEKGKLGFVITQSVFKTKGAGDGFRRFEYEIEGKKKYL